MGKGPSCKGFEEWVVKQLQLVAPVLSGKQEKRGGSFKIYKEFSDYLAYPVLLSIFF